MISNHHRSIHYLYIYRFQTVITFFTYRLIAIHITHNDFNGINAEYGHTSLQICINDDDLQKTLCALLLTFETGYLSNQATPIPVFNYVDTKVIATDSSSVHHDLGHFGNKKSPDSSFSQLMTEISDIV